MFKNYLMIAIRNLRRQIVYSFINISGLALGITAFILISVWVVHELSFDRFHKNASSIYRVIEKRNIPDDVRYGFYTPGLLSPTLKENFPEIKETTRHAWTGERVISYKEKKYYEDLIITVDPAFFSMFTFPFLKGDKNTALNNLNSIVITEKTADKYFGNKDPVGKILTLDNRFDFTVTGVIKNIPSNSHLQFDMAVPFEIVEKLGWKTKTWDFSMASTYIRLKENTDFRDFEKKITGIIKTYDKDTNIELFLQPLTKIHLFSNFANPEGRGRIQYVYVFSLVAVLILAMACINFMNLTTARAEYRSKEIGVRKVIGAGRRHLISQFLVEAVFLAFIALVFIPVLLELFLPGFNKITGETFTLSGFGNGRIILFVTVITLFTGLLSGSYPALFLSSFQPVKTLRGTMKSGFKGSLLRKILVFIQISISLILIIISGIIYNQVDFLKNKDLGFDKKNVISIPLGIANVNNRQIYQRLKNELKRDPSVEMVTASFNHPTWFASPTDNVVFKGKRLDESTPVNITSVDYDFIETLKIKMLKGRSFSKDFADERGNLIVNEMFEKLMGVDSALNQTLSIGETYEGTIIGVMKDFHIESVADALIGPLILFQNPVVNYIFVRIRPGSISTSLVSLEKAWEKVAPDLPFKYDFLDKELDKSYVDLETLGSILKYFTILAVFIACLGLFGLTSFSTERRTKEIGIRKILGSSRGALLYLLCRDLVKLVLLANICVWPISWWIMSNWLLNFPYRVSLRWSTFILSGLLVLTISLIAVSYQTVKVSLADPVDSIRYE
jgi:putative ABC transport system permease protein